MNKTQAKRYQLYLAILRFIEEHLENPVLSQIPIYTRKAQAFKTEVEQLQNDLTVEDLNVPLSKIKKNHRELLEEKTLYICKALAFYGQVEANLPLIHTFTITKHEVLDVQGSVLLSIAKNL